MGKTRSRLIGVRVGKLVVIKADGVDKHGNIFWLCKCDCGNETRVRTGNLTCKSDRKKTKSCGCITRLPDGEASFNNLYSQYRLKAIGRNYDFSLSKDEFRKLTKEPCHYCGILPHREHHHENTIGSYVYNGVDRVDNDFGYSVGNCVSSCFECNMAKSDRSKAEFLKWIDKVNKYSNLNQES